MYNLSILRRIRIRYETFKKANPPARLSTNMTQWEDFQLEATYKPGVGHFFWARKIKPGDVVDVHFKKSLNVKALLIVTGFDKDEERSGNDRLLKGDLLEAKDKGADRRSQFKRSCWAGFRTFLVLDLKLDAQSGAFLTICNVIRK